MVALRMSNKIKKRITRKIRKKNFRMSKSSIKKGGKSSIKKGGKRMSKTLRKGGKRMSKTLRKGGKRMSKRVIHRRKTLKGGGSDCVRLLASIAHNKVNTFKTNFVVLNNSITPIYNFSNKIQHVDTVLEGLTNWSGYRVFGKLFNEFRRTKFYQYHIDSLNEKLKDLRDWGRGEKVPNIEVLQSLNLEDLNTFLSNNNNMGCAQDSIDFLKTLLPEKAKIPTEQPSRSRSGPDIILYNVAAGQQGQQASDSTGGASDTDSGFGASDTEPGYESDENSSTKQLNKQDYFISCINSGEETAAKSKILKTNINTHTFFVIQTHAKDNTITLDNFAFHTTTRTDDYKFIYINSNKALTELRFISYKTKVSQSYSYDDAQESYHFNTRLSNYNFTDQQQLNQYYDCLCIKLRTESHVYKPLNGFGDSLEESIIHLLYLISNANTTNFCKKTRKKTLLENYVETWVPLLPVKPYGFKPGESSDIMQENTVYGPAAAAGRGGPAPIRGPAPISGRAAAGRGPGRGPAATAPAGEVLGEGKFGVITKGKWNGQIVAIKQYNAKLTTDEELLYAEQFKNEYNIMNKITKSNDSDDDKANVIQLIGTDNTENPTQLFMELCTIGSLDNYIKEKRNNCQLTAEETLCNIFECDANGLCNYQIALDIANGMNYLTTLVIIHKDLATRNILIDANGNCKIADFGMSVMKDLSLNTADGEWVVNHDNEEREINIYKEIITESNATEKQMMPRPICWLPYESVVMHQDEKQNHCLQFSEKSDVWSYGILLGELCTNIKFPYDDVFCANDPSCNYNCNTYIANLSHGSITIEDFQRKINNYILAKTKSISCKSFRITDTQTGNIYELSDPLLDIMTKCLKIDMIYRSNFSDIVISLKQTYNDYKQYRKLSTTTELSTDITQLQYKEYLKKIPLFESSIGNSEDNNGPPPLISTAALAALDKAAATSSYAALVPEMRSTPSTAAATAGSASTYAVLSPEGRAARGGGGAASAAQRLR